MAPPGCYEQTRVDLLNRMMTWATTPEPRGILWISGPAGTGKSALAKTACERLSVAKDVSLLSFFISRDSADKRDPMRIVPTLAFHAARHLPRFGARLYDKLVEQPGIVERPLKEQVTELLARPLEHAAQAAGTGIVLRPIVIVIDAVDECDKDAGSEGGDLLPSLLALVRDTPFPCRLLITSRPTRSIVSHVAPFLSAPASTKALCELVKLDEMEAWRVRRDVEFYLQHAFRDIGTRHKGRVPEDWPPPKQLDLLISRAGTLFLYATAVVRYVESPPFSPAQRLNDLLNPQIMAQNLSFDAVYIEVLRREFENMRDATAQELIRQILTSLVLLEEQLSVQSLANLLGTSLGTVQEILDHLDAVVIFDSSTIVRIFHPSFAEFLQDPKRCEDPRFRVDPSRDHGEIAALCLKRLNAAFRTSHRLMADERLRAVVGQLREKAASKAPDDVLYACKYWHVHLLRAQSPSDDLKSAMHTFCEKDLVQWSGVVEELELVPSPTDFREIGQWCRVCLNAAALKRTHDFPDSHGGGSARRRVASAGSSAAGPAASCTGVSFRPCISTCHRRPDRPRRHKSCRIAEATRHSLWSG